MSNRTLCLKPSGLPEVKNRPWRLVLRSHDLSGTDYETIALLDDSTAQEVKDAGAAYWLYRGPNWDKRDRLRALERARVLREEAEKIEANNKENDHERRPDSGRRAGWNGPSPDRTDP